MLADIAARLSARADREQILISEMLSAKLVVYLEVLYHWNEKINLTSLTDPDEAVDRLLLEPVAAARHLPPKATLADFGSGGGSPAIPLALALDAPELLMIESRSRKASFLREAAREIGVPAIVESDRFEAVARVAAYANRFRVVSIRAVRHDAPTVSAAAGLLTGDGVLALFRGPDGPERPDIDSPVLAWRETVPLLRSTRSRLSMLFHVEQPIN